MSQITKKLKAQLLKELQQVNKTIEYAPEHSYSNKISISFEDRCGCYSEWSTESCRLDLFLKAKFKRTGYRLRSRLEKLAHDWADNNLHWHGCQNCGGDLVVDVRLFPVK